MKWFTVKMIAVTFTLAVVGCAAHKKKESGTDNSLDGKTATSTTLNLADLSDQSCFISSQKQADGTTRRGMVWILENNISKKEVHIEFNTSALPAAGTVLDFSPAVPVKERMIAFDDAEGNSYVSAEKDAQCTLKIVQNRPDSGGIQPDWFKGGLYFQGTAETSESGSTRTVTLNDLPASSCFFTTQTQSDGTKKSGFVWNFSNDDVQSEMTIQIGTATLPAPNSVWQFSVNEFANQRIGFID